MRLICFPLVIRKHEILGRCWLFLLTRAVFFWPTKVSTGIQLYVWHHNQFIYDILCTIHKVTSTLWVHTIVVTTLYPLHSWHHKHYIRHHTHDNTKVYLPSHPLYLTLHPLYQCHQTKCINCITATLCMTLHTICITSHSVCRTSHEYFMTSHPYRYDITSSIFMTSYPIYMISPILFHENKTIISDISPTVFDITATASVWSHPLYQCLQNNYGSLHTWHTYDIIHNLHHIKSSLYDINRQYLGPHKHCIHDIRSIYDITSRFMTSHPLYLWHHSHYIGITTPTKILNTYQLYLTWNTLC